MIDKHTTIEQLVREYPQSVHLLMERGIQCMACGEPIWGTLESTAKEKGFDEMEIDKLIDDLKVRVRG